MSAGAKKLIDLYAYKKEAEKVYFLLLKRSANKIYSNQWRMVGGKVKKHELRWQAAIRELKEETGLRPELFWNVPTLNHFYEHKTDQIHLIPAFAAKVAFKSAVVLDNEHNDYKWVESGAADQYIFWPEQLRIINCISNIVINDQILPDWIINFDHI